MPIESKLVPVILNKGLNQKVDPTIQVLGQLDKAENRYWNKVGKLEKRAGFKSISNTEEIVTKLFTVDKELLHTGESNLYSFAESQDDWVLKGYIQNTVADVRASIRSGSSQLNQDMISSNGMTIVVWEEVVGAYNRIKISVVDDKSNTTIITEGQIGFPGVNQYRPRVTKVSDGFIVGYLEELDTSFGFYVRKITFTEPDYITPGKLVQPALPNLPFDLVEWNESVALYAVMGTTGIITGYIDVLKFGDVQPSTFFNNGGILNANAYGFLPDFEIIFFTNTGVLPSNIQSIGNPNVSIPLIVTFAEPNNSQLIFKDKFTGLFIPFIDAGTGDLFVKTVGAGSNESTFPPASQLIDYAAISGFIPLMVKIVSNPSVNRMYVVVGFDKDLVVCSIDGNLILGGSTVGYFNSLWYDPNSVLRNLGVSKIINDTDGASFAIGFTVNKSGSTANPTTSFELETNVGIVNFSPNTPFFPSGGGIPTPNIYLVSELVFNSSKDIFFIGLLDTPLQPSYFLHKLQFKRADYAYPVTKVMVGVANNIPKQPNGTFRPYTCKLLETSNGLASCLQVKTVQQGETTDIFDAIINLDIIDFDFSAPLTVAELNRRVLISGGMVYLYDGDGVYENGFNYFPEINTATLGTTTTVGGGQVFERGKSYSYIWMYEWLDNRGFKHRSAPSIAQTVVIPNTYTLTSVGGFDYDTSSVFTFNPSNLFDDLTVKVNGVSKQLGVDYTKTTNSIINFGVAPPAGSVVTISVQSVVNLTWYEHTISQNFKDNRRIVIYRTIGDGTIYYRWKSYVFGERVSVRGKVSLVDFGDVPDTALANNEILYTTGGELETITTGSAKIVHTHLKRVFISGLENELEVQFSKEIEQGEGVSFSDAYRFSLSPVGGKITALSSLDEKLIIFKERALFYVAGNGPTANGLNNDFTDPILIQSDVGALSNASVVLTPDGLMFKSLKGIWLLDRALKLVYIGNPVEDFNYLTITSATMRNDINQVRFTSLEGVTLVYDTFFQQWYTFTNMEATSAVNWQDTWVYTTPTGEAFYEDLSYFRDEGGKKAINTKVETSWMTFGNLQGYQRIRCITMLCDFESKCTIRIKLAYDFEEVYTETLLVSTEAILGKDPFTGEQLFGDWSVVGGEFPSRLQFDVKPRRQKCQSVKILIEDIDESAQGGACFALNAMTLTVGVLDKAKDLPTRSEE